MGKAREANALK